MRDTFNMTIEEFLRKVENFRKKYVEQNKNKIDFVEPDLPFEDHLDHFDEYCKCKIHDYLE